ncbi:MAG: 2-oxoacid:acceptor oxidoreductase subunit alpha [Planctomycetota bacterium]|jgi:2-oxoglutarate ferredoxin oxidoreductase subunit alpha
MRDEVTVMFGGEAGQGVETAGEVLAKSLVRSGFEIVVSREYMSRIRGGHNTFKVRAGTGPLRAPREPVDVLVAMNDETVTLDAGALAPDGIVVAAAAAATAPDGALKVPSKELAAPRYANTVASAVAASLLGLDGAVFARTVADAFGKKDAKVVEENRKAVRAAYGWAAGNAKAVKTDLRIEPPAGAPRRIMIEGNTAIALGALSAGVRFAAFYPMTPSTSINLVLAAHADELGLVVEQAEDEIAAINMGIGASFAGASAMVATSGGGFALMAEGVSLAAMTETPIVIAVVQRPGPATGLPTRTAQEDLEFVLHAGHGEFPRAVLAPGSVEECFHLTRKAFDLAERSQGPVFVLSDQFLADSYRAAEPFDVESLPPAAGPGGAERAEHPYRRYEITGTGVSPRLIPGAGPDLVVADSDEHDEAGHITEDLRLRKRMVEKRLSKLDVLRGDVLPPVLSGADDYELLLVSWGSTAGAAAEAADVLRAGGTGASALHFPQVWPLLEEQFLPALERARRVVCIEGNTTGQFARLVRRETGFVMERLGRYDGLAITPEYVVRGLWAMGAATGGAR